MGSLFSFSKKKNKIVAEEELEYYKASNVPHNVIIYDNSEFKKKIIDVYDLPKAGSDKIF